MSQFALRLICRLNCGESHCRLRCDREVCMGRELKCLAKCLNSFLSHILSDASDTFLFNQFTVSLLHHFYCSLSHKKWFNHHLIIALLSKVFTKLVPSHVCMYTALSFGYWAVLLFGCFAVECKTFNIKSSYLMLKASLAF